MLYPNFTHRGKGKLVLHVIVFYCSHIILTSKNFRSFWMILLYSGVNASFLPLYFPFIPSSIISFHSFLY